ncbi:MAG: uracil-DNA glycosylase [Gammaproteobacteria bacterium]|nr:uracil-DNA glycosylase [Gammaproteobacteria bacterium]
MGIDAWRLRASSVDAQVVSAQAVNARPCAVPVSSASLGNTAPDIATNTDWDVLQQHVADCTRCDLHRTRTQTVFGVGNRTADWLVIGEAPGAEEDKRGEPFVGRAGQLLDNMLAAIGLDRARNVYIANILKCRPPNNRDPQAHEVACCEPYLQQQIALIQPRLILAVGRIAAQNLLKTDVPLARLRGRVHRYGERQTPLIVTYHPAYLLRTPGDKRKAWEDLQLAVRVYRELGGGATA